MIPNLDAPYRNNCNEIAITQQAVIKAIKEFDANKTSRPGEISPKRIKEGRQELAYLYTKLFNLPSKKEGKYQESI